MSVKHVPRRKQDFEVDVVYVFNENVIDARSALTVQAWYRMKGGKAMVRVCDDGLPCVIAVTLKGWTGKVKKID
jgi:hypothetical protein